MSFKFLTKIKSPKRVSGITTTISALGISTQVGAAVTSDSDYNYYTWSAPSTGTSSGPLSFATIIGDAKYPLEKSRNIGSILISDTSGGYIECHGGGSGGKSTATFTTETLTGSSNFFVDIGGSGSPNGGSHAGFFNTSKVIGNSYLIAGGGGSPAPATGNAGGAGGGTTGANGSFAAGSGGPGPAQGGFGGSQASGGAGGSGAPGRCSGTAGSALQGGPLGGGDPSGRPGGGGGSGYYGGGAGGCGYAGNNNNPGGGGGGGSGYVHPSAQGGTNVQGQSQSGTRVVVRVKSV